MFKHEYLVVNYFYVLKQYQSDFLQGLSAKAAIDKT